MEISNYQREIVNWATNGSGNRVCRAVAGSGKTTTLKLVANELAKTIAIEDIAVIVFGKANAEDLIKKFGSQWTKSIKTVHSIGWSAIRRCRRIAPNALNKDKYWEILAGTIPDLVKQNLIETGKDLIRLIDLLRLTNKINGQVSMSCLSDTIVEFNLNVKANEIILETVNHAIDKGLELADNGIGYDFSDQIWLPVYWNLYLPTAKFVLVDECQDQNECQTQIMLKMGRQGRILAVGDPYQAIMGFAGANCDSYWRIKNAIQAEELPLSVCYRCPQTVIELVNKLYPQIGIEGGNPNKGIIHQIDNPNNHLNKGDLVISRRTAPLVTLCIELIAEGKNARIRGKDIGESLKREIEAITKLPNFRFDQFRDYALEYLTLKREALSQRANGESLIDELADRINALIAVWTKRQDIKSIHDFNRFIEEVFSDRNADYDLCTIHRAKGLEAERVFILEYNKLPAINDRMTVSEQEQERNLHYVAITRTKRELFLCSS